MRLIESLERRTLLSVAGGTVESLDLALPRSLTPAEQEYVNNNPPGSNGIAVPSTPPSGPIDPVAEYDGMVSAYPRKSPGTP